MATKITEIYADITARDAQYQKAMTRAHRMALKTERALNSVSRAAKRMLFMGGAAFVGLAALYLKQESAEARLAAALKSTGNAAGFSSKQLIAHAQALQKVTTFGDETIIAGQALLATFTQIKGPIFKEATEMILNMSKALGQDLKESAIQLGKALNDPILGVSALRRVGVNFNEEQTKMVRNLVETGRVMEAQKFILAELQVEFGGMARALGETTGGALRQALNQFLDLGEAIGKGLVPVMRAAAERAKKLADVLSGMGEHDVRVLLGEFKKLGIVLIGLWVSPRIFAGIRLMRTLMIALHAQIVRTTGASVLLAGVLTGLVAGAFLIGLVALIAYKKAMFELRMESIRLAAQSRSLARLLTQEKEAQAQVNEAQGIGERIQALQQLKSLHQVVLERMQDEVTEAEGMEKPGLFTGISKRTKYNIAQQKLFTNKMLIRTRREGISDINKQLKTLKGLEAVGAALASGKGARDAGGSLGASLNTTAEKNRTRFVGLAERSKQLSQAGDKKEDKGLRVQEDSLGQLKLINQKLANKGGAMQPAGLELV